MSVALMATMVAAGGDGVGSARSGGRATPFERGLGTLASLANAQDWRNGMVVYPFYADSPEAVQVASVLSRYWRWRAGEAIERLPSGVERSSWMTGERVVTSHAGSRPPRASAATDDEAGLGYLHQVLTEELQPYQRTMLECRLRDRQTIEATLEAIGMAHRAPRWWQAEWRQVLALVYWGSRGYRVVR